MQLPRFVRVKRKLITGQFIEDRQLIAGIGNRDLDDFTVSRELRIIGIESYVIDAVGVAALGEPGSPPETTGAVAEVDERGSRRKKRRTDGRVVTAGENFGSHENFEHVTFDYAQRSYGIQDRKLVTRFDNVDVSRAESDSFAVRGDNRDQVASVLTVAGRPPEGGRIVSVIGQGGAFGKHDTFGGGHQERNRSAFRIGSRDDELQQHTFIDRIVGNCSHQRRLIAGLINTNRHFLAVGGYAVGHEESYMIHTGL